MWTWIKKLFGQVEHEFEDIVAGFQATIDRLEDLVSRKVKLADEKAIEAAAALKAAEQATAARVKALATVGKLKELLAG